MRAQDQNNMVLIITAANGGEREIFLSDSDGQVIQVYRGETYRVVRVINGEQHPLEQVIASRKNGDLHLQLAKGYELILAGYVNTCVNEECGLQLFLQDDEYFNLPTDSIGLDIGADGTLIFAYGEVGGLMQLASGNQSLVDAVQSAEQSLPQVGQPSAEAEDSETSSLTVESQPKNAIIIISLVAGSIIGSAIIASDGETKETNQDGPLNSKSSDDTNQDEPLNDKSSDKMIIEGLVSAGEVQAGNDLLIKVFDALGNLLGESKVLPGGAYRIELTERYNGLITVRVESTGPDNDYKHEGTGKDQDLTIDLRTVTSIQGEGPHIVHISPITEIAAQKIYADEGDSNGASNVKLPATIDSDLVETQTKQVSKALGLSDSVDIIKDPPIAVNDDEFPTSSTNSQQIGYLLAAIAGAEVSEGMTTQGILNGVASGISGSVLNDVQKEILWHGAQQADNTDGNSVGAESAVLPNLVGAGDSSKAIAKIEAYNNGDGLSPPALTLLDYTAAGINGVTADNLKAVNAQVLAAAIGNADTIAKVEALIALANAAIEKIEAFNNGDGSSPAPYNVTADGKETYLGRAVIDSADDKAWSFTPEEALSFEKHTLKARVENLANKAHGAEDTIAFIVQNFADISVIDDVSQAVPIEFNFDFAAETQFTMSDPSHFSRVGNTFTKIISNGGWVAGLYSVEGFTGNGAVQYIMPQTNKELMIGLSSEDSGNSEKTINYGIYTRNTGKILIFENGENVLEDSGDDFGQYNVGDEFEVRREGNEIKYFHNKELLYTSETTVDAATELHIDSSFRSSRGSVENIRLLPEPVIEDTMPTLTGHLSVALGAGEEIAIYDTLNDRTTLIGRATVAGDEKTWHFTPEEALREGIHRLWAQVQDSDGRPVKSEGVAEGKVISESFTLQINSLVSDSLMLNIEDNFGAVGGALASGSSTDDTTPGFNGLLNTALAADEVIAIYNTDTGERLGQASPVIEGGLFWDYVMSDEQALIPGETYNFYAQVEVPTIDGSKAIASRASQSVTISINNPDDAGNLIDDLIDDHILTLAENAAGQTIDLRQIGDSGQPAQVQLNQIDITGGGDNRLILELADVYNVTATDLYADYTRGDSGEQVGSSADKVSRMLIVGDEGDYLSLSDAGWSEAGYTVSDGMESYAVYNQDFAQILVDTDINVIM